MKRAAIGLFVALVGVLVSGVPSVYATVVIGDLTFDGAEAILNGAIFRENDIGPTGSGVLDPFVRIHRTGSDPEIEQGYNTSGRPLAFDENSSPTFTHDLSLSTVPIFNINGTLYREFVLDINQTGKKPLLSLDQVKIFLSNNGDFADPSTDLSTLGTLIWDLDSDLVSPDTDRWVKMNYGLNSGSGSGDVRMFIPNSLFDDSYQYVYLYSKFGVQGGSYVNNDGFEEWAVRTGLSCEVTNTCDQPCEVTNTCPCEQTNTCPPPPVIPEPASLLLMTTGLASVGFRRLRRRRA